MYSTERALRRPNTDRMLAGVCAALARYFKIDVSWVRIGWVLFTLFGGSGVVAYLLAWFLIPGENGQRNYSPLVIIVVPTVLTLLCAGMSVLLSLATG